MAETKKFWERCPHCYKRYGSETSLQAHVNEHRAQYIQALVKPEHRQVLDPRVHLDDLRAHLKRMGHVTSPGQ